MEICRLHWRTKGGGVLRGFAFRVSGEACRNLTMEVSAGVKNEEFVPFFAPKCLILYMTIFCQISL